MRKLLILSVVLAAVIGGSTAMAGARMTPKVVYGVDNRIDPINSMNEMFVHLSRSTAAQISASKLTKVKEEGFFKINDVSLEESFRVCSDERFAEQNANARCSGSLVGPDLLVTAGHCVDQSACENNEFRWVFDYRNDEIVDLGIEANDVYNCKEVVHREFDSQTMSDFALIRLDRKVTNREPLKFRRQGKIEMDTPLVVIGHPSGLPTKIAGGATVKRNGEDYFFESDLDTFGGNSGSAVFNANTGVIEGILVRGAQDYRIDYSRACRVVNECDSVNGRGCSGEDVTRIRKVQIEDYL